MAAKLKESQAQDLLTVLRGHDVDQKINEFAALKAQIKHQAVETEGIHPLFEACQMGIASSNLSLSAQALSCLGHLIKRVTLQEPSRVKPHASQILPLLVDKLGDQKDRNRTTAMGALLEMWKTCGTEVERGIKDQGYGSRNARVRQESVNWLAQIHKNQQGFSFRSFTPFLMKLLEDSSESVRDTTKDVVVELFRNAPDHAKADLKRELQKRQVRKGIATYIVSQLGLPGGVDAELRNTAKTPGADVDDDAASSRQGGKSIAGGSIHGSMASSTYVASIQGSEMEELEPEYVNTKHELEGIFREMPEHFEGRESEHNWAARDRSVTKLRRLARGNAYRDFQVTFQEGIKTMRDGIVKQTNSLRTVVATNGLQLLKDLAIVMGPGLDPHVEIFLVSLVKLCAGTKKITAMNANTTTSVLLANVSFYHKIMGHISDACFDKNTQPRSFAAGWLLVILEAHIDQKAYMEHNGCVDVMDKCIKRGLADANPAVRESMRKFYWKYATIWPQRAEAIRESLEESHRKLLDKANPSGAPARPAAGIRGGPPGRSQTAGNARPSVREAILAQKRSKANLKTVPAEAEASAKETVPGPPSAGLSQAPVRRPRMAKAQTGVPERQVPNPLSLEHARGGSPTPASSRSPRGNGFHSPEPASPPLPRFARGVTPGRGRAQSPLVGSRKLTVLEQLNHSDWKVRVEGVIIVACILAKRTPPNYDGQKMPTLPPSDVFAPTLAKLLNDPQPEVVEHVVAPEVLAELTKVVPIEQIVPKVLLLAEGDDEEHAQPINASSLPALKQLMTEPEAAELLFKVITSMSSSGAIPRKLALGSFTTTEKRKISNGCMVWLNEIVESHINGTPNEFLQDIGNYKALVNRLIAMVNNTKPPNSASLATLLKNLERVDKESFSKILTTFETSTVKELRRAWGVNVEDDNDTVVVEEKVADVEQVLGSVPQVGGRTPGRRDISSPGPASPATAFDDSLTKDEDFTLINPLALSVQRPTAPAKDSSSPTDVLSPTAAPDSPKIEPIPDLLSERRRPEDVKQIEVYQDPVVQSNGAVAMADKTPSVAEKEWNRTKLKKQISTSNLPKTTEQSSRLLTTLIQRLQTREMDTQAFRKLIGVARENPARAVLQDSNGEDFHDIWEGGRVFEELLECLLDYLNAEDIPVDRAADLRVQGLLVLKQLLHKAAPYFPRHEAAVLSTLISLRGKYPTQSHVTTGIEEISEEFLSVADPQIGISAILDILPLDDPAARPPTQSWCMGLTSLAALVRASKASALEPQLGRLGQLAVKSLDDEDAEVRRASVAMCIEMHSKLGDDEKLFEDVLKGLKAGHQNLLTYYFAKRESESRQ